MAFSFDRLLSPLTDRLWAAYFQRCDADRLTCETALSRICREKPNFEHIVAGRPYKNTAYEKAVTKTSFELLGKAMNELSQVRKFRRAAQEIGRLCEQRDAAGVLAAIAQLKPRLETRAQC